MRRKRWSGRKRDRRKANTARALEAIRITEDLVDALGSLGDDAAGAKYFGADLWRLLAARLAGPEVRDA